MASDAEKDRTRNKFIAALKRPVFLIVINFFLVNTLFSLLPQHIGNIAYNAGRMSIIFYGGWRVVRKRTGDLRQAALAGALLYFVDHVFIKGGVFLLNYLFKPQGAGLDAIGGVLASFLLFVPLAMLIGAAGGLIARMGSKRVPADPQ